MFKKLGLGTLIALALVVLPGGAQAATNEELMAQIKTLTEMLTKLQEQVALLRGEQQQIKDALKLGLKEGMTDDDVRELQELLASDPTVYPEGRVTGYFGPLTKAALQRFQQKFELKLTGEVDEETHEYLEELLAERFGGKVPPGLLRAPGIAKKIEIRMKEGCDSGKVKAGGLLCQRLKVKYEGENDDENDDANDDENDDANDDDHEHEELEIEVEFKNDKAYVTIHYTDGDEEAFVFGSTEEDDVIDDIVNETDLTRDEVEDAIEFEDEEENDDANDDDDSEDVDEITAVVNEEDDETVVTVRYEDGEEDEYTYDTTDEDEVTALIADEIDMDEDDVADMIEFVDPGEEVDSIEVEFDGDDSDVTVEFGDGSTDSFTVNSTDHNEVIEEIADELDMDEDDVRDMVEFLDGELVIEVVTEDGEAEVDVTYENGDHSSFTVDSDDEDDIIAEIADRTGLSEDEVEDVVEFEHN